VAITASGSYTQNFDSLPTSGTSNVWSNDGTLAGWWAEQASGGAIAIIRAGDGGSNSGALYSFGTGTSTERALGSTSSGTPGTITFGVQLQNSTTSGQNLTLGDLQFTGEQWRNGGNTSSQQLTLWYRVSATPLTSLTPADDTGWTQLSALTFTSLVNTSTSAPLDGNSSANRTVLSASLSSISLPRGQYLFLRWKDINDIGNDHGFGIDDLSLSWTVEGGSTAVPVITSALTGTAEAGVSAGALWLELTETALMSDVKQATVTLRELRSLGLPGATVIAIESMMSRIREHLNFGMCRLEGLHRVHWNPLVFFSKVGHDGHLGLTSGFGFRGNAATVIRRSG
jgi:hypothetical protein